MASHLHTLSFLDISPYPPSYAFTCNLCRETGHGPLYHCSICGFDLHYSCTATSAVQDHFSHDQHPLHLKRPSTDRVCDGCGLDIYSFSYTCEACEFDLHPTCVKAPRFILHPSHPHHPLALRSFSTCTRTENMMIRPMVCDACKMPLHHQCYACTICEHFYLHQSCSTMTVEYLDNNSGLKHPTRFSDIIHEFPDYFLLVGSTLSSIDAYRQEPHVQSNVTTQTRTFKGISPPPPTSQSSSPSPSPSSSSSPSSLPPPSSSSSPPSTSSSLSSSKSSVTYKSRPLRQNLQDYLVQGSEVPNNRDLEGAENVLRFVQHLKVSMCTDNNFTAQGSQTHVDDEPDVCPTCLEGFGLKNQKMTTRCGHDFHLECILEWMDRSPLCPICRCEVRIMP